MMNELVPVSEVEKLVIKTLESPEVLEQTGLSVPNLIALWKQKNQSDKISLVLTKWGKQQDDERKLRTIFAFIFTTILFFQLIAINYAFWFLGRGVISFDHWTIRIFIISVFGEISGMSYVVLRYLFPSSTPDKMIDLIRDIGLD